MTKAHKSDQLIFFEHVCEKLKFTRIHCFAYGKGLLRKKHIIIRWKGANTDTMRYLTQISRETGFALRKLAVKSLINKLLNECTAKKGSFTCCRGSAGLGIAKQFYIQHLTVRFNKVQPHRSRSRATTYRAIW